MIGPKYVSFSNIIIDDIVLWDGRTFMNTIGGAGTHALIGMRVWCDKLGIVATIGGDLESTHLSQIKELGGDLRGLVKYDNSCTPRAWQLYEPDGQRLEIFRTTTLSLNENRPRIEHMPEDYYHAQGFHLIGRNSPHEVIEFIRKVREVNPSTCIIREPSSMDLKANPDEMREVLNQVDLFSPNLIEASTITKQVDIEEIIDTLFTLGAPLIAIRMGAQGSLVCQKNGETWQIPVIPTQVIDVTGAGNAYCGGFLVGLGEGLGFLEAALMATVSASFAVEQFGVPKFNEKKLELAQQRLKLAHENVALWKGNKNGAKPIGHF